MTTTAPAPTKSNLTFSCDRSVVGGVTILTMYGTLDDAFIGRKLAEGVKTQKVLIDMREVRRFASWGMSEWMDFLRINAERDLYLVECSTYAVSQINLVNGLLGHGKLVSFYASYHCGNCNAEIPKLIVIPHDHHAIAGLPNTFEQCKACGAAAQLDEYPASFFETIARRPSFDIDDEVLAHFRNKLGYDLTPDLTRFRAYRRTSNDYTYLRVSGELSRLPPDTLTEVTEGTTVVDLDGAILDPDVIDPWRGYIKGALPKVKSLHLDRCPSGLLEYGLTAADLHDKVKVRSFKQRYECLNCDTKSEHLVDVAENLEQLVGGTAPTVLCTTCKTPLVAVMSADRVIRMRALPARDRDPTLDRFLAKARTEPLETLENCLLPRKPKLPQSRSNRGPVLAALGAGVVVAAGVTLLVVAPWKHEASSEPVGSNVGSNGAHTPPPPPTKFERPSWIMGDVPSSAYCQDVINRIMCVGVSSYRTKQVDAIAEANDAALEELVVTLGLKISDPYFKKNVLNEYTEARTAALSALEAADIDRNSDAYNAANKVVTEARKRVVDALHATGGAALPAQRSDWYWEEYQAKKGGTEFLVFVRYDITLDAMKVLVEKYGAASREADSTMMTAFPGLAWEYAAFTGGVMITKPGHSLAEAKVAARDVVMAVGDQRVTDPSSFARALDAIGAKPTKLTLAGAKAPRTVELQRGE